MSLIDYRSVDIHINSNIILEDVTFRLAPGEFAYVVGVVGSGKSSLIKTIYGEVDIMHGDALLFGEYDMRSIKSRKLQALRKKIGIVFQDFQLLTDRNIHDNLDFVLRCTGWKDKKSREARINEVLELVGLPKKGYKRPHELSGGEQQRVVIARAILNRPALLLADEPTGNLDNESGNYIMALLHSLCKEENMAVLMITHNEQWLKSYPGTVYRCEDKHLLHVEGAAGQQPLPSVAEENVGAEITGTDVLPVDTTVVDNTLSAVENTLPAVDATLPQVEEPEVVALEEPVANSKVQETEESKRMEDIASAQEQIASAQEQIAKAQEQIALAQKKILGE